MDLQESFFSPVRTLHFTIPGRPTAWARSRTFTTRTGKPGFYTKREMAVAQNTISAMALRAFGVGPPHDGPVHAMVRAMFEVPKSWPRWRARAALDGLIEPTGYPDYDNILKQVGDALKSIVWIDDTQLTVLRGGSGKFYGARSSTEVSLFLYPPIRTESEASAERVRRGL